MSTVGSAVVGSAEGPLLGVCVLGMGVGAAVGNLVGDADGISVGHLPQNPSARPGDKNSVGRQTSRPFTSKQKITPASYCSSSGSQSILGSQSKRLGGIDGVDVGGSDGSLVGVLVGEPVGAGEGKLVGDPVGSLDGVPVGGPDGVPVGVPVGEPEGLRLGQFPHSPYPPSSASCTYSIYI